LTDRSGLVGVILPIVRGLIAPPTLYPQYHVELGVARVPTDHVVGIVNLDAGIALDICGGNDAGPRLAEGQPDVVLAAHRDRHTLEGEQNLDNVCLDPLDGTVFMLHTVDLDFDDGAARHRG